MKTLTIGIVFGGSRNRKVYRQFFVNRTVLL